MTDSHNMYHAYMNAINHLAYIKDENRRYIAINPRFKEFFDTTDEAIIGKTDEELWEGESVKDCKTSDTLVLEHQKPFESTERVHGRYFKTSKFPLTLDDGKIGIGAISEDVTEVIQTKNRLSSYFLNAPEGIFIINKDGKYLDANPEACKMTGYEKSQLLQITVHQLIPPNSPQENMNSFLNLQKEGKFDGEIQILRHDRQVIDVELRAVRLENGNYIGFCTDISNKKLIEKELLREKERLALVQKSTKLGLWDWNLKTDKVKWDNHCYEMLGFENNEFEVDYNRWVLLLHPDDRDQTQQEVHSQLIKGDVFSITFRLQKKDKSWVWIEARGKVVERDSNTLPLRMVGFHMDISDIHQSKQILEERDRLFQKLSEQVPGVIYRYQRFADGRSCFPFASEHIWDIYEVTPEEVKEDASIIFDRIHPDDYDIVSGSILLSWEKLTQWHCDYRVNLPNRGQRWLRGIANPQRQPDKSVIWHGYIADITEQKVIEKAFHKAREDAENAARIKSEFLANMSHEIRTPLNAIVGLGGLLAQEELASTQLDYVNKLNQSSQLLMAILNDILDYSKIEAGKLELDDSPLSIMNLLDRIYNIFSMSAFGKGISLEFAKDPNVPEYIYGDSLRLSQILTNLVSNAVKFTEEGGVHLHVSQTFKNKEYVQLSIIVKDSGIGMSDEMAGNLFNPFTQADSSITRRYGGSGLGLSIVKHLVEVMQGEITFESELGKGTSFKLSLRARIADEKDFKKESMVSTVGNLDGVCILLVEDNAINQEVATQMCRRLGAKVRVAENGKRAIDLYQASPNLYDIIFMDIQMPKMGGYEATQILRETGCKVPIIALTAAATIEDKKKALEIGMNDHLAKPIDSHALVKVLAKWLKLKPLTPKEPQGGKMTILQEDEALYAKLLGDFDRAWRPLLDSLVNELKNPNEQTQKTIHTLKGVSGNLALESLYKLCVQIDALFKNKEPIPEKLINEFETTFKKTLESTANKSIQIASHNASKCSLEEVGEYYKQLHDSLSAYDMVSYEFQLKCMNAFSACVDKQSLQEWQKAMDSLDYENAKIIMESWNIRGES